jgi:hypothetical protein
VLPVSWGLTVWAVIALAVAIAVVALVVWLILSAAKRSRTRI